jgi:endo-1,4-beta-xylanase
MTIPQTLSRRSFLRTTAIATIAASSPVTVRAFDASGTAAKQSLLNTLLLTSADGRPFELLPTVKGDGMATIELPDTKFEIMMILPVRGFGQVYLYADNGGLLYSAAQVPGGELLLNYEFARSRAAFVRRYMRAAEAEGVSFSPELERRLEDGEHALDRATKARDMVERVRHANNSLAETMWAGEIAVLERARQWIARRGPRPGFLFGCNAFSYAKSDEYAQRYNALLNFATLPFYRAQTERDEGKPDYSRVDEILAKMTGTGILTKGHPLVWFHRAGVPAFLKDKRWEDLKRSCRAYILGSVSRFRTRIHAWDVINEAHDWANDLGLDAEQLVEITRLASESTRDADPTAFRVVNSCCTWGEYAARRRSYSGPLGRAARTPFEYVRALDDAKVPFEAVGLQVYYPSRDMLEIERHLERFFRFGKPIHLTELGVSSSGEPVPSGEVKTPSRNVWHGMEWSEAIQADWAEQFYTICYSKPEIQAITWWDFADPSFIPHGGFLDKELRPKAAYERLAKLIGEWES